jgi:hypothetical protein
MPKGRCKRCGRIYYGWSLINREYRFCDCGGTVEIVEVSSTPKGGEKIKKN